MKSSRSTTSKKQPEDSGLSTPIHFVKGVGPRLGGVFSSRSIHTVGDLLSFFPRAYEDRTTFASSVSQAETGGKASLIVNVLSCRRIPIHRGRKTMIEARCSDESGEPLSLKWFHAPYGLDKKLVPGTRLVVRGTVKEYLGKKEILHPEMDWNAPAVPASADAPSEPATAAAQGAHFGRIVPVYVEIEGISTRVLRQVLWNALEKFSVYLEEDLPEALRSAHALPSLREAYRDIHFPPEDSDLERIAAFDTPSHHRLIYEEFLKFELLVLRRRANAGRAAAHAFEPAAARAAADDLRAALPFRLTGDQDRALAEILRDLAVPHPMSRLVQGDVGSGKTAVSMLAAGAVMAAGSQAALMAPTEILAEQHFATAERLFKGKIRTVLLTGSTTAAERKKVLPRLAKGEPLLVIGTHALVEDEVRFGALDLVLIDEQHRFGVDQRRALKEKGMRNSHEPHFLVLSATPIPRTLALTVYGDLAVSTIREKPPGRTPVKTHVVRKGWRDRAIARIRDELAKGRQAYFVYPLVSASEAEGFTEMKSAVAESETIARELFPGFAVELLHGQMKPEEKERAMARFVSGEARILVSTTVIEVGVDVPNATVMAVEHAERFGLSQLHQLRGRVGRGEHESFCFLFPEGYTSETTERRLAVLEKTDDGFKIAEEDLEIRGPGEFLGTRQSGGLPFRIANLVRDRDWLLRAREDAEAILRADPSLSKPAHAPLQRYLEREGDLQYARLKTS